MPTATSTSALPVSTAKPSLGRILVNFVLPGLGATVGSCILHLDSERGAATSLGRSLQWLLDQPVLLWALLFGVCAALTRYWGKQVVGVNPQSTMPAARGLRGVGIGAAWVALAAAAALGARAFFGEVARVRSTSMLPALYPGDLSWVSRRNAPLGFRGRAPTRGELVLFETPDPAVRELEPYLFKRVVGLEGDTLSVEGGAPIINGWGVPRCLVGRVSLPLHRVDVPTEPQLWVEWLGDSTYLTLSDGLVREAAGPFTVKPGEVWVLGDNRDHSVDSRNWFGGLGGGVPVKSVRGTPTLLLANAEGVSGRGVVRTESLRLPPGAEGLSAIFAKCLSLKPKQTLPPNRK